MQQSKFFIIFFLFLSFLFVSSCKSDSSELRKKASIEVKSKESNNTATTVGNQQINNDPTQSNDHYGAEVKTLTLFTVNWIMRIKEDGSGSFGQGQNGNLYAKFPKETFSFENVVSTLSSAIEESGSFGQSVAYTISGGPKVQKPNYVENFDFCASIFSKAYKALSKEEKAKIEETYKKSPPVSAYNR